MEGWEGDQRMGSGLADGGIGGRGNPFIRLKSAGRFGGEKTVHEWGNEYSNGDGSRSDIRGLNSWMVGVHNFNDTLRGDVQSP